MAAATSCQSSLVPTAKKILSNYPDKKPLSVQSSTIRLVEAQAGSAPHATMPTPLSFRPAQNEERLRVAVICDLREENWPSMDLVADSLIERLTKVHADEITPSRIVPPMRRRLTKNGTLTGKLFNADRFLNRFRDYPRALRELKDGHDLFHVVDHSYAHLVHELPAARTIVTCHDLDAFRCLLEPESERRSPVFKAMMRRVLTGMQKATRVTCDSLATRDAILAHNLLPAERLTVIPNGVHPAFSRAPDPDAEREVTRLLDPVDEQRIELLHVGSTIPRKRIDVLLKVFAAVRKEFPEARLVRVGGDFTPEQAALAEKLGLAASIVVMPRVDVEMLAEIYRRATLVLLPSEREGFGLPVIEALACGTPLVASDLPVLREVGADVVSYSPVADVAAWATAVTGLLCERRREPALWAKRQDEGVFQASRFTWRVYVEKTVAIYREVSQSCS